MNIYAVKTWNQVGDSLALAGAVHNVRQVRPDIGFVYAGNPYYKPLFDHNPDFVYSDDFILISKDVCYGSGERYAERGTIIEANTRTLCEYLRIGMVPVSCGTAYVVLTDDEIEWGRRFEGKWLVNANAQTCSVSKWYPHWQDVVDGMLGMGLEVCQIGGREKRDISSDLKGVEDWRGKTSLRQWLSMACNCAGIVSPPSGIVHAGAIWGKPMVVVTGAREHTGITAYPTVRHVTSECEHFGCRAQFKSECRRWRGFSPCMDIPPEQVLRALI